jgi:hypothetical protein
MKTRDPHPTDLLRPLLMGELTEQQSAAVEDHLAACADCRSERRALEIMLSETPAMDEVERARLRRGVAEALQAETTPSPRRKPGLLPRFAPALGAAATILLVAAGAVWVATYLGDGADEAALAPVEDAPDEAFDEPAGAPFMGGQDAAPAQEEAGQLATQSGRLLTSTATGEGPQPVFRAEVGEFGPAALSRLGSSREPFTSFASYHAAAATSAAQRRFVDMLAERADATVRPQVRACAETVLSDPPGAVLPAFGATGTFQEEPALVLGFVHAPAPGPLDRFMLWVWPRGDCGMILHYDSGRIEP